MIPLSVASVGASRCRVRDDTPASHTRDRPGTDTLILARAPAAHVLLPQLAARSFDSLLPVPPNCRETRQRTVAADEGAFRGLRTAVRALVDATVSLAHLGFGGWIVAVDEQQR